MNRSRVGRTILVVLTGLVAAAVLLSVRDQLWRRANQDDVSAAPPSVLVVVQDAEDGGVVPGASVSFDGAADAGVVTGASGRASLLLPSSEPRTLRVEADGYALTTRRLNAIVPEAAFRLQRGVSVEGEVRRKDGTPAANTAVTVRRLDWQNMLLASTTTDAEGRFSVNAIQERSVEVLAELGGERARAYVAAPREGLTLVLSDDPLKQMTLGAAPEEKQQRPDESFIPGAQRLVRVVDPLGKALPGARVYSVPADVGSPFQLLRAGAAELLGYTDSKGEVVVPLERGSCLIAGAWPHAPSALTPCVDSAAREESSLRVLPAAWIDGEVNAEGGADLWLVSEEPEGARAATDGSGRFRMGPLSPGTHALTVVDRGGAVRARVDVKTESGETASVRVATDSSP